MKVCTLCKLAKPEDQFGRRRLSRGWGLRSRCKMCRRYEKPLATIDNTPFVERFLELREQGVPISVMASRMGYNRRNSPKHGHADVAPLRRHLGLQPNVKRLNGKVYRNYAKRVRYDTALRLCVGLDLDPVDVGL